MNFGGDNQPGGIVIATGNSPTPCGSGTLLIDAISTNPVHVGGFISYYLWKKDTK